MLQHVIKWAVFAAAWRQFRPYLFGTLAAVVAVFLVATLHADFVEYLRLAADILRDADPDSAAENDSPGAWLLLSFLIKWLGFVLVGLAWWFYFRAVRRVQQKRSVKPSKASKNAATPASAPVAPQDADQQARDDAAFDFLRAKTKLEGRGDKILSNARQSKDR